MLGGKVVKEQHKTATHAKESSKNGKFKHKGQFKTHNTMKEEDLFDLTFDLTLALIRKRGDGRITSIQPYESQGERTISIDYDEQQARIAVVFHQNDYIQIRCSFTFTSFVQTFEYVFDDKMKKKQKEKILGILLDNALQNGNGTSEEILFTIN